MASQAEVVLCVNHLTRSFGDLVAVRDLSFEVVKGEVLGFLGPNGAGKTTSIRMICGLLSPDSGTISILGTSVGSRHRQHFRRFGFCPQELVIWETLTCLEQMEIVGRLYDLSPQLARERSLVLLDHLGLGEKRNRLSRTLSGGMKRRLNIALALVHDPDIIILDEPQAGLDPQSRILVREYIQTLVRDRERIVILTTHDMDEADRLADRIAIIDHGRLLELDTSANLKSRSGSKDILEIHLAGEMEDPLSGLGSPLPDCFQDITCHQGRLRLARQDLLEALPEILEQLKSVDLEMDSISMRQKTLEDVFVDLTGRGLRE